MSLGASTELICATSRRSLRLLESAPVQLVLLHCFVCKSCPLHSCAFSIKVGHECMLDYG
jgi:hypothetical protein